MFRPTLSIPDILRASRRRLFLLLALLTALTASRLVQPASAWAWQNQPGSGRPATATASNSPNDDAPEQPAIDPKVMDDPVVRRVMIAQPTTPEQLTRAIRVLIQLDRPQAARLLIDRLMGLDADDDTWAELAERFGVGWFSELRMLRSVQPQGKRLAARVLDAFQRRLNDPARLSEAVKLLGDASPGKRKAALLRLRGAGPRGAALLVAALRKPPHADQLTAIQNALLLFKHDAAGPLTAVLETNDPLWKARAAAMVARLEVPDASLLLLAPALSADEDPTYAAAARRAVRQIFGHVPEPTEAVEWLRRRAARLYRGVPVLSPVEAEGDLWHWNADAAKFTVEHVTRRRLDVETARRLAASGLRLAPRDSALVRLHLSTLAESYVLRRGWETVFEQPIDTEAALWQAALSAGPNVLSEWLDRSRLEGHVPAAVVAARLLGKLGRVEVLHTATGQPSALALALRSADERLRFAALEAIVRLDPLRPFPGSSLVPETLGYFATWQGAPLALTADVRLEQAREWAALLQQLGYEAEATNNGRDLFSMAVETADLELILLGMTLDRPTTALLLEELRRDARTANVPIALVATELTLPRARRLAEGDPLTKAILRPHSAEAAAFLTRRLRQATGQHLASRLLRQRFARASIEWIAQWAADPNSPFDLRSLDALLERALDVDPLREGAIAALAHLNTPRAQRALVDLASRTEQPILARQAAAQAFAQSVDRFGILLTNREILRQYDRYNASEHEDEATQQVLASILDTLERPHAQANTPGRGQPASGS